MKRAMFSVLVVGLLAGGAVAQQPPAAEWKAGVARVVITPEKDMWMAGYASRNKPSEGKVHDLHAKALAVEDHRGKRLVIVTLDLISVPRPLRDALHKAAEEKFGLSVDRLLVNCSHTHCGPEIRTTRWSLDGLPPDRLKLATDYVERLQRQLLSLVGEAIDRLSPARLSYCRARCAFAMNRRTPSLGGYRNFPNPDGPVDHDVPVLKVEDPQGKLRAVVFGYACHNTTLGFYKFCGDYAGFAQQYFEEDHPGVTALFMMGCGGDQNPYPRRTLELAQRHGRTLATAVEAALDTHGRELSGPLQTGVAHARLEYQEPPTKEQLEQQAKSKNKYDRLHAERLLKQLAEEGQLLREYRVPVQIVRFGNQLTLVALPGETVVDYSLRLKRELAQRADGGAAVWVAGYSNDVFAYIPSRRVLLEGGYEAGGAMRYMTTVLQPGPFKATVEQRIVGEIHRLNRMMDDAAAKAAAQ